MRFNRMTNFVALALRRSPGRRDSTMRLQCAKPRVDVMNHRGSNTDANIRAHQTCQLVRNTGRTSKMIMLRDRVMHMLLGFNYLGMIKKIGEKAMNHRVAALRHRMET